MVQGQSARPLRIVVIARVSLRISPWNLEGLSRYAICAVIAVCDCLKLRVRSDLQKPSIEVSETGWSKAIWLVGLDLAAQPIINEAGWIPLRVGNLRQLSKWVVAVIRRIDLTPIALDNRDEAAESILD